MKTAVSIPDDVFKRAETLARNTRKSRSQLFSDALREYVARHGKDEVTEAMDNVCLELKRTETEQEKGFRSAAARRILSRTEW